MKYNNCIKNLLKLILMLQNNSSDILCLENDCCKPFLGPSASIDCYNTRVITLYNKDGSIFNGTFYDNGEIFESPYFRVLNINDDCCTLLILNRIDDSFVSTNQTVVVKIGCICAIKCVLDISLNL